MEKQKEQEKGQKDLKQEKEKQKKSKLESKGSTPEPKDIALESKDTIAELSDGAKLSIESKDVIAEKDAEFDMSTDKRAKEFGPKKQDNFFAVDESSGDSVIWIGMSITCKIGPKLFKFEKDKKYRVSKNVKEVLLERGALRAF